MPKIISIILSFLTLMLGATCSGRERKVFSISDISRNLGSFEFDESYINEVGRHIASDSFASSLKNQLKLKELPSVMLISEIHLKHSEDDLVGTLAYGVSIESDDSEAIDSVFDLVSAYVKARLIGFSHEYCDDLLFGEIKHGKLDPRVKAIVEQYNYVNANRLKESSTDPVARGVQIYEIEDSGYMWEFIVWPGFNGEPNLISERKTRIEK